MWFPWFTEPNTSNSSKDNNAEELSPTYENSSVTENENTNISDINKNVENANNTVTNVKTNPDAMEENSNGKYQAEIISIANLFEDWENILGCQEINQGRGKIK